MRDDAKAGVKSTGVILADYIRLIVTIFTIGLVSFLALAGKANGQGVPYFVFGVGGVAIQMAWQLMYLDVWSPASCWCECCTPPFLLLCVLTERDRAGQRFSDETRDTLGRSCSWGFSWIMFVSCGDISVRY